jgi:hypothetical protein
LNTYPTQYIPRAYVGVLQGAAHWRGYLHVVVIQRNGSANAATATVVRQLSCHGNEQGRQTQRTVGG